MAGIRVKVIANFIGSALTLGSAFVPWISYSDGRTLSLVQAQDAWLSLAFVVSGGIISLLSRYGGLLTTAGLWQFVAGPPIPFLFVASNVVIAYRIDAGVWFAWAGATICLLGSSWSLPFGLMTIQANRKEFGLILFPLGVIVTVFGSLFPIPGSVIGILAGLIVIGASIALLFPLHGRTLGQIFKALVRTDKQPEKELGEAAQ